MSVNRNVQFVVPLDYVSWPATRVRHEKIGRKHILCIVACLTLHLYILEFLYFEVTHSCFVFQLQIYFLLKTLVHNIQSRINRLYISAC
jgi:hypothetical protein